MKDYIQFTPVLIIIGGTSFKDPSCNKRPKPILGGGNMVQIMVHKKRGTPPCSVDHELNRSLSSKPLKGQGGSNAAPLGRTRGGGLKRMTTMTQVVYQQLNDKTTRCIVSKPTVHQGYTRKSKIGTTPLEFIFSSLYRKGAWGLRGRVHNPISDIPLGACISLFICKSPIPSPRPDAHQSRMMNPNRHLP